MVASSSAILRCDLLIRLLHQWWVGSGSLFGCYSRGFLVISNREIKDNRHVGKAFDRAWSRLFFSTEYELVSCDPGDSWISGAFDVYESVTATKVYLNDHLILLDGEFVCSLVSGAKTSLPCFSPVNATGSVATGSHKQDNESCDPTTLAERTTTMPRDITNDDQNPAGALKARYTELMEITDAHELSNEVFRTVANTHFSQKNRSMFDQTMEKIEGDLVKIQFYISNFVLKAGGNGVI